ncbi:uncharacterized protein LOC9658703 isoform X1 [Selaginella moellendorffii]|uniref:uncharacterized protein LOC9658703 isoform X1 n=1 Tax=Selaginella moellendorffii TaxID=88036 RepID=UPI000D1CE0A3|nr:uncharacterized protein LOC9658703 isoform X1 [Selaginella moellendorffii]XP_024539327.1 uncharacterized protein LOC9658703 isoform X1 [Selaginella moellendorffii]|eukprot:XP_024539326.1 uncharacterized protein LOC9658703 isoform X1 [Selaginella moellendorffii]
MMLRFSGAAIALRPRSLPALSIAARARAAEGLRFFASPTKNSSSAQCSQSDGAVKESDGKVTSPEEVEFLKEKPDTCTGDELHYVSVAGGKWKLALWRYLPVRSAPARNHPLLLLSGVATNALGFDLDPSVSFARYMSSNGFDTWILEMRAAGLSKNEEEEEQLKTSDPNKVATYTRSTEGAEVFNLQDVEQLASSVSKLEPEIEAVAATIKEEEKARGKKENGGVTGTSEESSSSWEITKTASQLSSTVVELAEKLRAVVNEGQSRVLSARLAEQLSSILEDAQLSHRYQEIKDRLVKLLEERKNAAFTSQLIDLSNRLTRLLEETQVSVSRVRDLQSRLTSTVDEFQKFLDLIVKYDWDFDHYLEEDVPAAIEYVRNKCNPKDGKLLGVGHSMGGIILYALLASKGKDSGIAAAVTLASSLDYSASNSSLHMLLPLADPAQVLNVPVVPLGAIMQAVYPLVCRPPYALAWLGYNVSASGMMDPDLYKKLVYNNFCTVPAKLLLQLRTAFQRGGLKSRDGNVMYKDLLSKSEVPVYAIAGDADLVCPPSAVIDTVCTLPTERGKYEVFGGRHNRHYGHYDLLVSRTAKTEVFPAILKFFEKHDMLQ